MTTAVRANTTVPVNARLGVGDLVETGYFEPVGVSSLTFVHVVPKGQDHLQELAQGPALDHLPGRQTQSWKHRPDVKDLPVSLSNSLLGQKEVPLTLGLTSATLSANFFLK